VKINESKVNLKKRFLLIKRLIKPDIKFFKKLNCILSIFLVKKLIVKTIIENNEMRMRKIWSIERLIILSSNTISKNRIKKFIKIDITAYAVFVEMYIVGETS
tara:strand:+ start:806 stop:1114 length:309 start_codon:yes stop_codon:yes gene_type:complete